MRFFVVAGVILGGVLLDAKGGAPALASPPVLEEAWDSAVPGSATLALLGTGLLGLGLTMHRPRG